MKDTTFSSKAYGTRESKDVTIEGRVQFDVLQLLQACHCLSLTMFFLLQLVPVCVSLPRRQSSCLLSISAASVHTSYKPGSVA